jgi:hypothetical protein
MLLNALNNNDTQNNTGTTGQTQEQNAAPAAGNDLSQ